MSASRSRPISTNGRLGAIIGSFAGAALNGLIPEGRSIGTWLRQGWHIPLTYAVSFFLYLAVIGYQPEVLANGPGHS